MRLWSVHPSYLDTIGLVACWREGLLAKAVLENKTIGYKNHPQLERFKKSLDPILSINAYLSRIYDESVNRGYKFDKSKIIYSESISIIALNDKQFQYEFNHLCTKLRIRSMDRFNIIIALKTPFPNPLFHIIKGEVENWEKIS